MMTTESDDGEFLGNIQDGDTRPLITADKVETEKTQCVPTRYNIAFVTILGYFAVYLQRSSFNIALVAMVNFTEINEGVANSTDVCPVINYSNNTSSSNEPKEGEFTWDSETQNLLLGSFYYGYIVFQILGGFLSDRFSSKIVLGVCILIPSVITLLMPVLARWDVRALIAARVLTGLVQGPIAPCIISIWGRWTPVMERAKIMSIMSLGSKIGSLVSPPITGLLCASGFLGGWPSVFYLFGTVGCLWFVIWMLTMHDSPAKHPTISHTERRYIEESIGITTSHSKKKKVPTATLR